MNVSNATNCSLPWPTVEKEKTVIAIYSTFAAVAIIAYFSAIIMIVKTRAYRLFTHRLTLYLAFGGVLLSLGNILQIVPVDLNKDDQSLVSTKAGLEDLCIFAGFFRQYTLFLQTLTVVWICLYIFGLVVRERQLSQLKHELVGVTTIVLAPLMFTWEPFITNSYGLRETRCWIAIDDCNNAYNVAFAYQLAINMVPSIFLITLSLSLIGGAVFVVTKKTIGKNLERHHRLAIKEILPLTLYPFLYLMIVVGRIVAVLSGKFVYDVADAFMALEQLSSFAVPLSLLIRVSIRQRLFHGYPNKLGEMEPLTTTMVPADREKTSEET